MAVLSNFYPPIVETYMPAFVKTQSCRVYFALSQYMNKEDIKGIHVTVRDQYMNLSALDPVKYPSEMMLLSGVLNEDSTIKTDYKYYIEINDNDIRNGFTNNLYYKVQIRFSTVESPDTQAADGWLSSNLSNFSEWSTVALIRSIPEPIFSLTPVTEADKIYDEENFDLIWSIVNTQLRGKLEFSESTPEALRSYKVILTNGDGTKILSDSGEMFKNISNNEFVYTLKYGLSANSNYKFIVEYTTTNLYKETHEYSFKVVADTSLNVDVLMSGEKDPENGRICINVKKAEIASAFTGTIVIRRTSSNSNFTIWEDVYKRVFNNANVIDFSWNDYSIESGVWYDYAVQGVSDDGKRGIMTRFIEPSMVIFEHMYLTGADKQLKIAFNPTVSSFKRNYIETKNDTIGSKYPFIRRNGITEYAQIPISGLIASDMDEDNLFTSPEEIYGENEQYYIDYNRSYNITKATDIVYEKAFRDKVEEFLYDGKVKILRSPTEGVFLVRLMDVSFTPQQTLGRRIWNFSATAYEVAEYNEENLKKYGFIIEETE